jgi:hypothetical protein
MSCDLRYRGAILEQAYEASRLGKASLGLSHPPVTV